MGGEEKNLSVKQIGIEEYGNVKMSDSELLRIWRGVVRAVMQKKSCNLELVQEINIGKQPEKRHR